MHKLSLPRPADFLNFMFLVFLMAVVTIFHRDIPDSSFLIAAYSSLIFLQVALIHYRDRNGLSRWIYDLIFPTACILFVFDSLGKIVHFINPRDIDPVLIKLDYLLFGANPAVVIESITRPLLTDVLQLAYASYYFLPLTLGITLKTRQGGDVFDRSLFFIMLCFYLSYVGYMLWPALGPRFTINYGSELSGFLLANSVQEFLNKLEGIKRDAFPSGHTGIALTVLYLSFRYERRLFRISLPFVFALIFSTVYLRYHYVVDVMAGVFLALITVVLGETYYGFRSERVDINH